MQVEVITRHAVRNYGSLLQALATRKLLENAGADVRFVDYRQPGHDDTGWSYANHGAARRSNLAARAAYAALRDPGVRKMGRRFENSLREELALTQRVYRSAESLMGSDEFRSTSLYCVGSDQVWNLDYNIDNRPYTLDFAPVGTRKFSLSSSIGAAKLPELEERRLVEALRTFSGVSVREAQAAEYLETLGVSAEVHLDPTLALEPRFWESFSSEVGDRDPYVLIYQLNGNPGFAKAVDAVTATLGIPALRVEYWRNPRSLHYSKVVLPGLSEFVGLFKNAAFVVTDSFHGVSFATTFGRPFVVLAPPKYSGRISSLLDLTQQSWRLVADAGQARDVAGEGEFWKEAEARLSPERERLRVYIESMLAIGDSTR